LFIRGELTNIFSQFLICSELGNASHETRHPILSQKIFPWRNSVRVWRVLKIKTFGFQDRAKMNFNFFLFLPYSDFIHKISWFFFFRIIQREKRVVKEFWKEIFERDKLGISFLSFYFWKILKQKSVFRLSQLWSCPIKKKLFLICPWENHWWWKLKQINFFSQCIGLLQRKWNFKNIFPSREDIWTKYWWAK